MKNIEVFVSSEGKELLNSEGRWKIFAWKNFVNSLRDEFGHDVFSSWLTRLELESVDCENITVSVPTRFLKSWIETHYLGKLKSLAQSEFGISSSVVVEVRTGTQKPVRVADASSAAASTVRSPELGPMPSATVADHFGACLDGRLSLQSFVVGTSNALAFAVGERIAANADLPSSYNPLLIHAGVGLGKTHLLQGIAQEAIRLGKKVAYFTADRFMYCFLTALKSQTGLAFKERLCGIDMLVIDDAQFVQGRSVQAELGHTINALIDLGKQVVVAADRMPAELESLDERVRSRLAGGLVVEIGTLDEELRYKILAARLQTLQALHPSFVVSADVAAYVARQIETNGRDLDGAASRLLAHATLSGKPLTVEMAETAIRDLVRLREPKRARIDDIQKLVAEHYHVSRADILSERRTAAVVKPRQIAMYLAHILTNRSLPEIGRRFGGRDHTTVLHAVRKIESEILNNNQLESEINMLSSIINRSISSDMPDLPNISVNNLLDILRKSS